MTLTAGVFFVCLIAYAMFLVYFAYGFIKTKSCNASYETSVPLTIIICARNESKKIQHCIASILKQDYDFTKLQLLLIDDASHDFTGQLAESVLKTASINYKIITNSMQLGKKVSITKAMAYAINDVIILRDADTFTTSTLWLQNISDFYTQTNADIIIGPIAVANNNGVLWALQAIETNILSVITCGSTYFKNAFLCSGANLIFTKTIFKKVNGYSNHIQIASGDDVLFLEDVKKIRNSKIEYLKSEQAIVFTYPCYSLKQLVQQKIRWASKFKYNKSLINLILATVVFLVNSSWLIALILLFYSTQQAKILAIFVFFKLIIDILLLFLASSFVKNKELVWFSLPVSCIYPIYAIVVAISSAIIKPKWKI